MADTVLVTWDDPETGHKYVMEVPNRLPMEHWGSGLRLGPPDILNLPPAIALRLNQELFNRGIITWKDARKRRPEVEAALKAALKLDVDILLAAYNEESGPVPVAVAKGSSQPRTSRQRAATSSATQLPQMGTRNTPRGGRMP